MTMRLLHYEWRERVGERLVVPCSDPYVYEQAADGQFDTLDEALAYRTEWFADDPDANGDDWLLLFVTSEVVTPCNTHTNNKETCP